MQINATSDLARANVLRQQSLALKREADAAGQELTTGLVTDIAHRQRGNLMPLVAVESSLLRLEAYRLATAGAETATARMQQVMAGLDDMTSDIIPGLVNTLATGQTNLLSVTLTDATARFGTVLSALNTRSGERSLFAGQRTDGPAVADAPTILGALKSAILTANATTPAQIGAVVEAWFAAPGGFASVGYVGGPPLNPQRLSPDDEVQTGFAADEPALRDLIKGLAMASLAGDATVVADAGTRAELAQKAGEVLLQNQTDRAVLASRIGAAEARIDAAAVRNTAETASLTKAQSDLRTVDPYEAAVRMESAQTQLESLYAVTARLSRLNFVDFLR